MADEPSPTPSPVSVIPYRTAADTSSRATLFRLAVLAQVIAIGSITFNALFVTKAVSDWRQVDSVVRSRDPLRRIVKVIERGRPKVFPSKVRIALFVIEGLVSAALAGALLVISGRFLFANPQAEPWRLPEHVLVFARWKLRLFWLGPLVAIWSGANLSQVRQEFEVFGSWLTFDTTAYALVSLGAMILACTSSLLLIRVARVLRYA